MTTRRQFPMRRPTAHARIAFLRTAAAGAAARAALVPLLLAAAAPVTLTAQSSVRSAAILILRGNDTLVVERIQRGERSVSALIASPGQPRVALTYTLGPGHGIPATSFLVFGANTPDDALPLQSGRIELAGDSAFLEVRSGGTTRPMRLGTRRGALPVMNNDFVVLEQVVRMARARGVTSLTLPFFALSGAQTIDGTLDLVGADSARFRIGGNVTEVAIDAAGNITGGTIPAPGMRLVVVTGTDVEKIAIGRPDYSAPAGAPYVAEDVVVTTPAGHRLAGTLTRPASPEGARGANGRLPAVVTITGSGLQDRDEYIGLAGGYRLFRQVADTLSRRGIAVLRLDDRATGGSGGDPDGTSADFADDIRAAVAYLRSRADVDPARIALVGHSEGGMIAPMIAATDPRLAAIVLMAGPAYTGRRIIEYQIEDGVRGSTKIPDAAKDSAIAAQRAAFDSTATGSAWLRFFLTYDPLPTVRRVRQPVLILQGATDHQIRAEEARMLEAALRDAGNRRVTATIFADRNHLFLHDPNGHPSGYAALANPRVDGEVLGALADWLVTVLGGR